MPAQAFAVVRYAIRPSTVRVFCGCRSRSAIRPLPPGAEVEGLAVQQALISSRPRNSTKVSGPVLVNLIVVRE